VAARQTVDFLRKEAAQGNRKDYLDFLDAVPAGVPMNTDRVA